MKRVFYIGFIALGIFEISNVYFIMPMPGSQRMESIELAYFLYSWRWLIRGAFLVLGIMGVKDAIQSSKWIALATLLLVGILGYIFNFQMTAEKIFLQPENVVLKSQMENELPGDRLVLGVEKNGEAKAYPLEFVAYHHQIKDSLGGEPMIVTYCSVCRTGRVFEPMVNGQYEQFRLVGMDQFNAMFEDKSTGSWWRQVNGEAIAGQMKGTELPEIESQQVTIDKWFTLYPDGLVMQPGEAFMEIYDSLALYEKGKSESSLTRRDSLSWEDKSWIVGIELGNLSKAYDWNDLNSVGVVNDMIGEIPILLALSSDGNSFVAFERPADQTFTINDDDLILNDSTAYDFSGKDLTSPGKKLKRIQASQEYWHSWRTFHPNTERYQ